MNELVDITAVGTWYISMFYLTFAEMFFCEDCDLNDNFTLLTAVFWPIRYVQIVISGWYGYIINPKSFLN